MGVHGNIILYGYEIVILCGYLSEKWSGELQLEIKEGCVHVIWMPPLLTNSWIFFNLIKAYHKFYNFLLHKGHNSEISKVKLIELDLLLVILNNISRFGWVTVKLLNRNHTFYNLVLPKGTQLWNVKSEIGENRSWLAFSGS